MNYYTYRITNKLLKKHYYGYRSCNINPKDDLGVVYFSSSTNKDFLKDQLENPINYKYKIIRIYDNKIDALNLEILLHNKFNVGVNESFYNKVKQSSNKFDTTGISCRLMMSTEYKINNGWINCKVCNVLHSNVHCCSKECFSAYMTYDDNDYSQILSKTRSEFINENPEKIYKAASKGANKVDQEIKGKKISATKNRNNSGNNNPHSTEIQIFNDKNELIYVSPKGKSFKLFCEENNLPLIRMKKSYQRNVLMTNEFSGWRVVKIK